MKTLLLILLLSLPFFYVVYGFYFQDLTDPIKYFYTFSGYTAIILLYFTTTISIIKSKINLMRYRKDIGLSSFFYALLHLLNFFILDMELDITFAFQETLDKPFIYLGMTAFLLILFMAITSTKELFKRFVKYHKVIYVALILTTTHFIMAQKALSITQWWILGIFGLIGVFKVKQRLLKR